VIFVNVDDPKDRTATTHIGYGIDSSEKDGRISVGDKGPGKAISYAFKYALLKTFCLETGDDPDNDANSAYEPAKCLQFDSAVQHLDEKELEKLNRFLSHCAQASSQHVEDVKREALTRMDSFLTVFKKWNPKKKDL